MPLDFLLSFLIPLLFFGVFGLFFFGIVAVIIYTVVKNVQKAKSLGQDPFTMQTELTAQAINSNLLAPQHTIETRLTELDALHTRGVITQAEYDKARAEAISAG